MNKNALPTSCMNIQKDHHKIEKPCLPHVEFILHSQSARVTGLIYIRQDEMYKMSWKILFRKHSV